MEYRSNDLTAERAADDDRMKDDALLGKSNKRAI